MLVKEFLILLVIRLKKILVVYENEWKKVFSNVIE
jgi:hypothetical protein